MRCVTCFLATVAVVATLTSLLFASHIARMEREHALHVYRIRWEASERHRSTKDLLRNLQDNCHRELIDRDERLAKAYDDLAACTEELAACGACKEEEEMPAVPSLEAAPQCWEAPRCFLVCAVVVALAALMGRNAGVF